MACPRAGHRKRRRSGRKPASGLGGRALRERDREGAVEGIAGRRRIDDVDLVRRPPALAVPSNQDRAVCPPLHQHTFGATREQLRGALRTSTTSRTSPPPVRVASSVSFGVR